MTSYSQERRNHFRGRYAGEDSATSKSLAALALGEDVGVNGYTTIEQAERLSGALNLSCTDVVLDLGSGRGWPGTQIGYSSGCKVVLTDLPLESLRQANGYARAKGISKRIRMVCADGTALPFARTSFDAVAHADVLC